MPLRSCSSVIGAAFQVSMRSSRATSTPVRPCGTSGSSAVPRPVGRFPPSSGPRRRPPRAAEHVGEVEDRTVVAPQREVVGVAVGDRAGRVDVFERTTLPTMRSRWRAATESPGVKPVDTARSAVSITVMSRPPLRTNVLQVRDAGAAEARTHVVGLILGCRGSASRASSSTASGCPTSACRRRCPAGPPPPGGKTMTSYFALRLASFAISCVLM